MPAIFRAPSSVSCFYCQTAVTPLPRNPRSFRCPHCDCWNRYDANGEVISDEPAMHDENLNIRSFARRASPRKDRLPSAYGSADFCHTCQTNQMLLTNLLSNYLPPPDDPRYEARVETLPEYQRSIEVRYPPVCSNCLPIVEEKINKADQMARVRAFGGALKNTKGTDSRRRTSGTQKERDKLEQELRVWKTRGCLWAVSLGCAVVGYASVATTYHIVVLPDFVTLGLPLVVLVSILWTAWDPTYAGFRRARFQGRAVRVHGRKLHISMQVSVWLLRMCTAVVLAIARLKPDSDPIHLWDSPRSRIARVYCYIMLFCELCALLSSALLLKVQYPPSVRLVDSKSHLRQLSSTPSATSSRDSTPVVPEPELFSTLTLSNKPVLAVPPSQNPIFGVPSFTSGATTASPRPSGSLSRTPGMDVDMEDDDADAMDIDPASPMKRLGRDDDASWLRPQRFFAPEEPTGLENLFAKTIQLVDSSEPAGRGGRDRGLRKGSRRRSVLRDWRIWVVLCIVPLVAVGYKAWAVRTRTLTPMPLSL